MSEEQERQTAAVEPAEAETEATDTPTAAEEKPEVTEKPARGGAGIALIILALLALAAVGVSLYIGYEMHDLRARQGVLSEQHKEFSSRLDEAGDERSRLEGELARLQQSLSTTTDALEQLRQREQMDNFDWALAEVEYLTIIAMQRLSLAREPQTALAALEAAARRLKNINDPALIAVREQYTEDLNALRAVPEIDVPGIALYLGDLITRAEQLPLASDPTPRSAPAATETDDETPASGWRDMLGAIWQELRQLVVIQREDDPPPELLAPDERYYLYQNLRVELASARAAALRRDTRNLHASIELMRDWLQRYFDTGAPEVGNILEALGQMTTQDLTPELPDISSSLESLRAYQRRQAEKDKEVEQ